MAQAANTLLQASISGARSGAAHGPWGEDCSIHQCGLMWYWIVTKQGGSLTHRKGYRVTGKLWSFRESYGGQRNSMLVI